MVYHHDSIAHSASTAPKGSWLQGHDHGYGLGYWQTHHKHQRTASGNSDALVSDSGSDSFSGISSGKTSLEYGPKTPTLGASPTIDQFHFGMDFEAPTFPTEDTVTIMAQRLSTGKFQESFMPLSLPRLTSYLGVGPNHSYPTQEHITNEYVDKENVDFTDCLDYEEDGYISDDAFDLITVEVASTVTFFKPVVPPALISITGSAPAEKHNTNATRPRTRQSSRSSTVCSQYSWAEESSSGASETSMPATGEIFYEAPQWVDGQVTSHTQCTEQDPCYTKELESPSAALNDRCLPSLPDRSPLHQAHDHNYQSATGKLPLQVRKNSANTGPHLSRSSRIAKKSLSNLKSRVGSVGEALRVHSSPMTGAPSERLPASSVTVVPVVNVPARSSSRKHFEITDRATRPQPPPSRLRRQKATKYSIFPQILPS